MNATLKLLAVSAFALLAACAPKEAESADAAPTGKGPAMWSLADEDSTIYLFGTFHILPSSLSWTTAAFDEAMKATTTTVTEVDTKSPQSQAAMTRLVQELGLNPPGVTLSSTLGETRAARFAEVAGRYGLNMAEFEPLRPWLAMIALSVAILQKEGFSEESGAEATILARASAEGDRIAHLESAEYQVRALASLDEAEILADFDSSLDQFDEFKSYAKRVVSAWKKGDAEMLEKETLAPMREAAPLAFRTLITDRNRNWTVEIERMLAGDEDYFIAVGAGHLIGEDSVVDMLEERGYEVRRVQ